MLDPAMLKAKFEAGHNYDDYVATGTEAHQDGWNNFHSKVSLTDAHKAVLGGFVRTMPVLVSSGTWCGDCVQQVPMLDHIARATNGKMHLKLVDRDEHSDLAAQIKVCGGMRVPVVIYMNEDFEPVAIEGDRTLSRYRALADKALGASCPVPGGSVPADEIAATVNDWVELTERAHLILRLSGKLRERYGD
ncbi:MAG: thioredoxin family protein [Planctomycetota bacterium]